MPTQLITNYFRLHNVKQFKESVSEVANSVYYVFTAKSTPYPLGDENIPNIENTENNILYNPYSEMLFGKRVGVSDVSTVTQRYNWTPNTVYTAYRNDQSLVNQPFYACVNNGSSYNVFKCLDNNGGLPSTIPPDATQTSPNDEYYSTSDGYVWKYMYNVDSTTFNKFATVDFIPVSANAAVVGNAVSGAIEVITVSSRGSNYNTFLSNSFISTDLNVGGSSLIYNIANNASASSGFYIGSFIYLQTGPGSGEGRKIVDYVVTGTTKSITISSAFNTPPTTATTYEITPGVSIVGDGSNAIARAIVNTAASNSIVKIEILNRGKNYSYAYATVTGNTGGVSNNAVIVPILGPKGGHGFDPEHELNATGVCISVSFANSETGTIPVANDYRQIGILRDPLFANVVITTTGITGAFQVGEIVTQANTGTTATVASWDNISTLQLTNVNGIMLAGNTSVNYLTGATSGTTSGVASYQVNGEVKNFNTFDQRHKFTYTPVSGGTFDQDEVIYQTTMSQANAFFHSNTNTTLYLTSVKGTLNTGELIVGNKTGATANLLYYLPPDLVVGSGEVIYIENILPITRANNQTETTKFVLQF